MSLISSRSAVFSITVSQPFAMVYISIIFFLFFFFTFFYEVTMRKKPSETNLNTICSTVVSLFLILFFKHCVYSIELSHVKYDVYSFSRRERILGSTTALPKLIKNPLNIIGSQFEECQKPLFFFH